MFWFALCLSIFFALAQCQNNTPLNDGIVDQNNITNQNSSSANSQSNNITVSPTVVLVVFFILSIYVIARIVLLMLIMHRQNKKDQIERDITPNKQNGEVEDGSRNIMDYLPVEIFCDPIDTTTHHLLNN